LERARERRFKKPTMIYKQYIQKLQPLCCGKYSPI
jgi:hypothetical protein